MVPLRWDRHGPVLPPLDLLYSSNRLPGRRRGKWSAYTPDHTGGLLNVKGPNYFRSGMHADNLGKNHTRRVNDADGDGTAGFTDEIGTIDTKDLRPGDLLFYDWDGDKAISWRHRAARDACGRLPGGRDRRHGLWRLEYPDR